MSRTIGNVTDFLEEIFSESKSNQTEEFFFRGVSNKEFKLIPNAFRKGNEADDAEHKTYIYFKSECFNEFKGLTHMQTLTKIQHFGGCTRLIDFSTNPLVSLYFSCCSNLEDDGCVYILHKNKDEVKFEDSDKVLMLSCLAAFSKDFKEELVEKLNLYRRGTIDEASLKKESVFQNFYHEICREFPTFVPRIVPEDLLHSYVIKADKDNPRIIAQSGLFVILGLGIKGNDLENDSDFQKPKKLTIPKSSKKNILNELMIMGIDSHSLFPDLDHQAINIAEMIKRNLI